MSGPVKDVTVGSDGFGQVSIGPSTPMVLIAGPCVIESLSHAREMAAAICSIADELKLPLIYKSSYDKANRTSGSSFRGLGVEEGCEILQTIRNEFRVPVVTDVHSPKEAEFVASYVDLLQIPAFLCRQTDLLIAAGKTGRPVMVKKGQFLAPEDMGYALEKCSLGGAPGVIQCERGACFGYRDLVVDFRSLLLMRRNGHPVVFDATHSVQSMGGAGGSSSGKREFVPHLARAAVAFGVDGIFLEVHNDPNIAPSDGPNMLPLSELRSVLLDLRAISEMRLNGRDDAESVGANSYSRGGLA